MLKTTNFATFSKLLYFYSRLCYNIICQTNLIITKDDLKILPPYIRVLAVNERGRDILSKAKKTSRLPVGTSLAKLALSDENTRRFAEIEAMASDIYALSQNKIGKGQSDYKTMIKLEKADEDENI